jgi:serine/threonine protein phosphatase PrpC
MRIVAYGATDVGQKREHNEDFYLIVPSLGLHVVCDGMGGHAAGEVAAEMAARTVAALIEREREFLGSYDDSPEARDRLLTLARTSVEDASRLVHDRALSEAGRAGMGTTLIMLMVVGNKGVMAHVGDSRLYMLRAGKLHHMSEDHNYAAEMIKYGMPPEQARKSPFGNRLTRAIGIQAEVKVDTLLFDVLPNDLYLLCSDGLTTYFEGDQEPGLVQMLQQTDRRQLPERLVAAANERGGQDNISAVVVSAVQEADRATEESERTNQVNRQIDTLRHVSLFRDLTLRETVAVLSKMQSFECAPGHVLIREGERDDRLFVLVEGHLLVTRQGTELNKLSSGALLGEMALVSKRPRTATVTATQPSKMLLMERTDFETILHKAPALGIKLVLNMAHVLSERLDDAVLLGRR